MKRLLFTHGADIDGMGNAILAKLAFENIDIIYPSEAWGWGLLDIFETFETMRETI